MQLRNAVASLLAMIAGWAAGYGYYVIDMTYFTDWKRPTDQAAILFWSAILVVAGWLFVALPAAVSVSPQSSFFGFPTVIILGALIGIGAFMVFIGWAGFWRSGMFLAYPGVVGAVASTCYAAWLRISGQRDSAR